MPGQLLKIITCQDAAIRDASLDAFCRGASPEILLQECRTLDEFRRTAESLGATPVFVYLPIEGELTAPMDASILEERFFVRYCRDREVRALDLHERFLAERAQADRFRRVGHWRSLEHRIAAKAIAGYLLGQHLVPTAPVAAHGGGV